MGCLRARLLVGRTRLRAQPARHLPWCLGLLAALALGPGAQAAPQTPGQQAAAPAGAPVSAAEAEGWLQRIQQAAAASSYQGTLTFNAGGSTSSARVLHYCDGRQTYERLELLDGESRVQYRHNEQVVTLWPAARRALLETRDPIAQFPALPLASSARVLENYELHKVGQERMAGQDADVLLLKPRDRLRFPQRLWAQRETGLLLRNDILGPAGEVLESAAFVDLRLGSKAPVEQFLKPMKQLDGWRVLRPPVERTQLEAEGWAMSKPVAGFQLVSCVRRTLDAGGSDSAPPQVIQSVFSDGLSQVSVFIERYDPQRHARPIGSATGASHTVMARRGDWWITVVGEVPMATAQQFESVLERKR
jgi:sigma-E factor negative regulatory protein RseB